MSDWRESGQQAWDKLASDDAYWAVLTDRTKNDRELRSFFVSGQHDIERIRALITAQNITLSEGSALDYGCGVGRLSRALAAYFDQVTGVDVSPVMLDQARQLHSTDYPEIRFISSKELFQGEQKFDLVLSLITLQHIESGHMKPVLSALAQRAKDDGCLVVQIPDYPQGWEAVYYRVRRSPFRGLLRFYSQMKGFILDGGLQAAKRNMEMNGLPKKEVVDILKKAGLADVRIVDDHSAGPHWKSYIYIARS